MQKTLNAEQIAAFYHDGFVSQQVAHFKKLCFPLIESQKVVVDIGGGCGYFAAAIKNDLSIPTRVIDMDPVSVESAQSFGVEAIVGDALRPPKQNDEAVVCFNLILHHLVANSEGDTLALQAGAISAWRENNVKIFINEYIYESWVADISGWIIYQITKSKFLSAIANAVSKILPSLKANTLGVGVRFRSNSEWRSIFKECGFSIAGEQKGEKEFIPLSQRLLLIKEIRRDSFFLVAK